MVSMKYFLHLSVDKLKGKKYLNGNPMQLSSHTSFVGADFAPMSVPTKEVFAGSSYSSETFTRVPIAPQKISNTEQKQFGTLLLVFLNIKPSTALKVV